MRKANLWTNKDGLVVGFGTRNVEVNSGATVVAGDGIHRKVVMKIVGTEVAATAPTSQLVNGAVIPAGSHILSATLVVDTPFVGATAALKVGGYLASTLAADDDDGFITAANGALANIDADDEEVAGSGAYVGTTIANNLVVGCDYDTAAFTAGAGTLVIEYIAPTN